jgi:hypothetical protein
MTYLEEEEKEKPLQQKKRMLPLFPQLLEQVVLSSKDVNEILVVTFIKDISTKKD